MSSIKIWQGVRDWSKLELALESESDTFVGGARLVDDQGNEEQWSHDQLHPGPKRKTLRSPRKYVVRVRVAFTGSSTATVTIAARIVKPDGSVHGNPYAHDVSGKNGTIKRATILISMKS